MSRRHWVFDASPLIVLGKIGQLDLVEALCGEPVIPEAVAEEIRQGPVSDAARQWLEGVPKTWIQRSAVLPRVAAYELGRGESAALSYACLHDAYVVILDERTARTAARSLGLNVRGTLGILLLAKREGHIEAVRPQVKALLEVGFRIGEALLEHVLKQAGES